MGYWIGYWVLPKSQLSTRTFGVEINSNILEYLNDDMTEHVIPAPLYVETEESNEDIVMRIVQYFSHSIRRGGGRDSTFYICHIKFLVPLAII